MPKRVSHAFINAKGLSYLNNKKIIFGMVLRFPTILALVSTTLRFHKTLNQREIFNPQQKVLRCSLQKCKYGKLKKGKQA